MCFIVQIDSIDTIVEPPLRPFWGFLDQLTLKPIFGVFLDQLTYKILKKNIPKKNGVFWSSFLSQAP